MGVEDLTRPVPTAEFCAFESGGRVINLSDMAKIWLDQFDAYLTLFGKAVICAQWGTARAQSVVDWLPSVCTTANYYLHPDGIVRQPPLVQADVDAIP